MYLWVVIATFLAALFALNVSLRSDVRQLYTLPQAEIVITKLFDQQRAAEKLCNDPDKKKHGDISSNDLKGYLPYGFSIESGVATFTTKAYCLTKDDDKALTEKGNEALPLAEDFVLPEGEDIKDYVECSNASIYVVTYGNIPVRWRNRRTNRPSTVLLNAMHTTSGFINNMGYVIPRDKLSGNEKTDFEKQKTYYNKVEKVLFIPGKKEYVPIPNYIAQDLTGCTKENDFCLLYINKI